LFSSTGVVCSSALFRLVTSHSEWCCSNNHSYQPMSVPRHQFVLVLAVLALLQYSANQPCQQKLFTVMITHHRAAITHVSLDKAQPLLAAIAVVLQPPLQHLPIKVDACSTKQHM
jgi:hypothetical protein